MRSRNPLAASLAMALAIMVLPAVAAAEEEDGVWADAEDLVEQAAAVEIELDEEIAPPPAFPDADGVLRLDHRSPSWRWAIGGQLLALTGGTIWYVLDEETNAVDWDYRGIYSDDPDLELRPQSDVWRRFDGWRFDDNVMVLNTPLHPMAGSGYYLLARSSSLGMLGSLLAANTTSLVWETVIEHQEVVSINDLVYTGLGGFPLGEMYYQLGQFFRHSEPTRLNRALSWVFGLPLQLRDLVHGTSPQYDGPVDERGWPTDIWHNFVLHTGFGTGITADSYLELGASAELNRLPDFQAAGEHEGFVYGPLKSSLAASISANDDYVHNWKLDGRVDFAGHYLHDMTDEDGPVEGTSLFVGTGMGFRHVQHWFQNEPLAQGDFLSRYGIVHLPGLRLDTSWMHEAATLRLSYSAYPDITSIDSVAYPIFAEETGRQAARTVLANERYYYGFGFSNLLRLEADMDPAHFHVQADLHWSRSINARDRFKHEEERFGPDADDYLTLIDRVANVEMGALFALPAYNMRAGLVGQMRRHDGTVRDGGNEWTADRRDLRMLGVLQLVY